MHSRIELLIYVISLFQLFTEPFVKGYNIKCPGPFQRIFRSEGLCNSNGMLYTCLYNTYHLQYSERCIEKEYQSRKGRKRVFSPAINEIDCEDDKFQPIPFTTNSFTDCMFRKSKCKEEGQVIISNGSTFIDRTCKCDYDRGYVYVTQPKDKCSCVPSQEDCSCFLRHCKENEILSADYDCVPKNSLRSTVCGDILDRIVPSEETVTVDTCDKIQLQQISGSGTWSKQASVFLIVVVIMSIYTVLIGFLFCSVPHVTSMLMESKLGLSVKRKENEFLILNGGEVKIECNVKSYLPVRSVTWQQEIDGEVIQITPSKEKYMMNSGKMQSLTIHNFNSADQGKYRCIVRNTLGLRNRLFVSCMHYMSRFGWLTGFVSVLQHIPVFHTGDITLHTDDIDSQSKPTVYNVYKGDDITMEQCCDDQQKCIAVKWIKESDTLTEVDMSNEQYTGGVPEVPSLTIKSTTIGNAGKYICLLIYDKEETQKALFKLKIIPQVKIYKGLCDHREDRTFMRPAVCDAIDKLMQENKIVVITGREGTGKSKICLELASRYDEKDYMVLKVDLSENHLIYTDIGNSLLIIDDQHYTQDSLNAFMKDLASVLPERNIQVVLTCKNLVDLKIVRNVPEINKLKSEAFIDINSCLTPEEKEEILRRHMKENNISLSASYESNFRDPKIVTDLSVQVTLDKDAIKAIKTEEPWKGFPVCASLFCSERKFLHLGEQYFTNPPKYLFDELKTLHKTARKSSNSMDTVNEYCILVYILENSNHQLDLNDPNLCRKLVELYQTLFQFKYIPEKPGPNEDQKISIEKALHRMNNKYLKLHEGMYQFIHPCLSKAMFLSSDSMVYYLLQNGSLQDITEFVRSEDYTALENELVIKVDKQYHQILSERFVRHAFEDHELLMKVADYICTYWRLSGEDYTGLEDELVIKITKDFHHIFDEKFMKHVSEDHDLLVKIAEYTYTHWHSSGNMLVNVFFSQIAFILFKSLGIYTDNLQQLDIEQNSIKAEIQVSLFNIIRLVERLTSQGKDPWIYGTGTADFLILSGLVTAAVDRYAANINQTFDILLSEFQKRIHSGAFVELLSKPLDRYGNTFFHYLMGLGQKEASKIVSVIAERKCVLDTENVKKYTPLDIAAFLGKKDIFKVLNLKTSNCTDKLCKRLKGLAKCGQVEYYNKNSKDKIKDQKMIHKTKDGSVSPEKLECEGDDNDKKEVIDENKKDRGVFKRENSLRKEEHKKREKHDRKDVLCFEEFMNNMVDNGKIEDYQSIIKFLS